ncbi:MAG: N-6 DNA methylase [Kiritimatiellia bacterium]|jgi:type I restriction enzyme M protein
MNSRSLSLLYQKAHDRMRDVDGLLPLESFDELLKFLFFKECQEASEQQGDPLLDIDGLFRRTHLRDPVDVRQAFPSLLKDKAPWALQLWRDGVFHMSDSTLLGIQDIFSPIRLSDLPLDIRSTALRTFLTPEIRRGLGIYLTPEDVVRTMVAIVDPMPSETVFDPACGSGTFLVEAIKHMAKVRTRRSQRPTVFGIDKNPRMLLLAELNLGHGPDAAFKRTCADSLRMLGTEDVALSLGIRPNSMDVILTNPPFGMTMTRDAGVMDQYQVGATFNGNDQDKVPSEILFLELCLRLLRPGGRLGIVLPRSVITNDRLAFARASIDTLGYLTHLIDLPPETFAATGTQTTTVAAFFKKHSDQRRVNHTTIQVCHVSNVGYDSTGRHQDGNQLPDLPGRLLSCTDSDADPPIHVYHDIPSSESLQRSAGLLFQRTQVNNGMALHRFVELAGTGRTPPRAAYTDDGMFILKVGNLTGRGVDWDPRDRNFVSYAEARKRATSDNLMIQKGDILLTSSAHSPKYIAKKVDIVTFIPKEYETLGVTFVGEIIRVRAKEGVDPYLLLAALRHPTVRDDLQAVVRGQTAHLNPCDLMNVNIPCDLAQPSAGLKEIAAIFRKETELAFQLNSLSIDAMTRLASLY